MARTVYALDFETYYDKVCSIVTLGLDKYVRHPEFEAYLVTVAGSDGYRFAGHPSEFPWHVLDGQTVVSHNAAFDHGVYNYLAATGKVPQVTPHQWECSSDLSAYLGVPRSLAGASSSLLKVEVSKDVRDQMKGKRWESMTPEFQSEVMQYAIKDAELCLRLWTEFSDAWPENERQISRLTRESCWKGLYIDQAGLSEDLGTLHEVMEATQKRLPWAVDEDAAVLSTKAFRDACEACGVTPPPSLNKQDEETKAWVEAHPEVTWLRDMWDYRSATVLAAKLESILVRVRDEDGRMGYGLKYAGAHTLRDSGDSGINVQNLPRDPILGVHLRSRITAAPGNALVACDLSAIEPRSLTYLAKDFVTLEEGKKVKDWYEVQARSWGLFDAPGTLKETDPKLRHMIKGMSIGLGYAMSANKFSAVTKKPLSEAEATVALFRAKNPKIVQLWSKLDLAIRRAAGGDFNLMLPSGRPIRYRSVRMEGNSSTFAVVKHGKWLRIKGWRGLIAENITQAFARDVFMDRVLAVRAAGLPVVMRVHDEVVCEVPEADAEDAAHEMERIVQTSPDWCPDLPLAAEAKFGKTYADAK